MSLCFIEKTLPIPEFLHTWIECKDVIQVVTVDNGEKLFTEDLINVFKQRAKNSRSDSFQNFNEVEARPKGFQEPWESSSGDKELRVNTTLIQMIREGLFGVHFPTIWIVPLYIYNCGGCEISYKWTRHEVIETISYNIAEVVLALIIDLINQERLTDVLKLYSEYKEYKKI